MDPKQLVGEPRWIESITIPGTNETGFAKRELYADGRVVITYYRRGNDTPVTMTETVDPDQRAAWEKQKAEATRQTDQAERKVKRTYRGVDPATGKPALITEYESGAPTYEELPPTAKNQSPIVSTRTEKDAATGSMVTVNKHADGSETREEIAVSGTQKPASPVVSRRTEKNEITGQTITINTHADGTETRDETSVVSKPDKQETANVDGVPHRVVRDAQGNVVRYEPIEVRGQSGLSQAPAWQPRIDQPGLGLFERKEQLRQFYAKKVEEGMSPQEAKAAFERDLKDDYALAQTVVAQVNAGTQNESTIYQGDITQRSQDLTAANSRLNAATTIHTNALSEMSRLAPTAGAPAAKAYRQLLNEAHAYNQRFGGLNTPPRVQPRPGGYLAMPPMSGLMGGQQPAAAPAAAPQAAPPAQPQAPAVPGAMPQPEAVPNPMAPTLDPMGGQTMAARISPAIANAMGQPTGTVSDILASLNFDPEAIAAGVEYRASLVNGGPMTPGAMVGM